MADIKIPSAISAYQSAANITGGSQGGGEDFSSLLGRVVENTADSLRAGEAVSARSLLDEASVEELTLAISNAEMTLRTVTAVRDRLIQAYQEIIKMPI